MSITEQGDDFVVQVRDRYVHALDAIPSRQATALGDALHLLAAALSAQTPDRMNAGV